MNITDAGFVKEFIRMGADGYALGWHERNAGNLSYRLTPEEIESIRGELDRSAGWSPLGVSLPDVAEEYFLVTGTGTYFRNIGRQPARDLGIVEIDERGEAYRIVWGLEGSGRPTSEFPSHLVNHAVKKKAADGRHRVIYHAHPAHIVALTFVLPLSEKAFTRELWSMNTECPIVFPAGVGVVGWMVPGGAPIAAATGRLMKKYDVVVWAHHGVFCSGPDFDAAFGLMQTVEKSAEILVKVRSLCRRKRQTITSRNMRELAQEFKVDLPEEFLD